MLGRNRSYRCEVCRWQGSLEPTDAGDAAPCPNCGVHLYPLSAAATWGVVLVMVAAAMAAVGAAALLLG